MGRFAQGRRGETEVVFTSLPGPKEFEAVVRGDKGLMAGMQRGQPLFDLSTNSPTLIAQYRAAVHRARRRAARQSGERRPGWRASGKMAIWVGGDEAGLQALSAGARCRRRPGLVYRSDRCGVSRQAGAQSQRLHDPDGAGRGLHHGRQGGRRSADLVEGGAQRRHRPAPAPSTAWPTISCPTSSIRRALR